MADFTDSGSDYEATIKKPPTIERSQKYKHSKSPQAHSSPHKKYTRNFHCKVCPKSYVERRTLRRHMLLEHGVHTFTCKRCGADFKTNDELDEHSKIHAKQTVFLCSECGKNFSSNQALNEHLFCVHTEERPFKCMQCDRAFSRKLVYDLHMKRHSGK